MDCIYNFPCLSSVFIYYRIINKFFLSTFEVFVDKYYFEGRKKRTNHYFFRKMFFKLMKETRTKNINNRIKINCAAFYLQQERRKDKLLGLFVAFSSEKVQTDPHSFTQILFWWPQIRWNFFINNPAVFFRSR